MSGRRAQLENSDEIVYSVNVLGCDGRGRCVRVCVEKALRLAEPDEAAVIAKVARLLLASCCEHGCRRAALLDSRRAVCRQSRKWIAAVGSRLR